MVKDRANDPKVLPTNRLVATSSFEVLVGHQREPKWKDWQRINEFAKQTFRDHYRDFLGPGVNILAVWNFPAGVGKKQNPELCGKNCLGCIKLGSSEADLVMLRKRIFYLHGEDIKRSRATQESLE